MGARRGGLQDRRRLVPESISVKYSPIGQFVNRTVVNDSAYAPYGEAYENPGTDLEFTGQFQDTLSGQYDFTYRPYNPGNHDRIEMAMGRISCSGHGQTTGATR